MSFGLESLVSASMRVGEDCEVDGLKHRGGDGGCGVGA